MCTRDGEGYCDFLVRMGLTARSVLKDWRSRGTDIPLCAAACRQAGYDRPLPIGILLDHYNWLTIKGGLTPPAIAEPQMPSLATGQD